MRYNPRVPISLLVLLLSLPAGAFDFSRPFEFVWSPGRADLTELDAHTGEVTVIRPFPDGKRVLTLADYAARVWDFEGRKELLRIDDARAADLSADGRRILTYSPGALALRDAESGAELRAVAVDGTITSVKLGPDGRRAVAFAHQVLGTGWEKAFVVDLEEGKVLRAIELVEEPKCFALSSDLTRLVALAERKGRLYDLDSGEVLSTWAEPKGGKYSGCSAAFSPDGRSLLVSRDDAVARLRSLPDGREKRRFELSGGEESSRMITEVFFSKDGKNAMAGSLIGLWAWEAATGRLATSRGPYDRGQELSPDGTIAYSAKFTSRKEDGEEKLVPGWVFAHDAATGKRVGKPLPGAEKASVRVEKAGGGTRVSGYGADAASLAVLQKAYAECFVGYDRGFEMMASCLKTIRKQAVSDEPVPPAPELTQGAYESRAAFQARVEAAKKEFEAKLAARERRLAALALPKGAMPVSFLLIFGDPAVRNSAYDPETRLFTFDAVATGANSGGWALRLALKDPVPNEEAEAFHKRLAGESKATLAFRVEDNAFSLERVYVTVGEGYASKSYEAVPADAASARALESVSIGELVAKPVEDAGLDVSFGYAQSRELLAKKKELAAARKQRAAAAEIAALEAQLKALSPAEKEIDSDADAPVAARPEDPAAYAVVVGVESYQMTDLPKARFAERDARSVAKRLEALGVPPRNMKVLIGSGATRAKLAAVLQDWLPQRAKEGAKVYFYFSGHGAPDASSGDSYLVPWDGDPSLLKATGYRLSALYADLAKLPAAKRVALLDACFSGAGGRSLLAKGARPLVTVTEGDSGGVTVLAAAASSQITATLESQGHGLFTYHLLKALGAGGRSASAVFAELKPKVEDDAARQSREQTPAFRGPDASIP